MTRRKSRERQGLFVAEGVRAVEELLRSPLRIRGALVAPRLDATPRGAALHEALASHRVEIAEVSERDFESAADTETPQGVLAIAEIPDRSLDAIPQASPLRLLVLDAIQDPGNVGTMLRTAAALGAAATIALPGTVDLWNAKVVRSAMGAHFRHPALHSTVGELQAFLARRDVPLWGAEARGTPLRSLESPGRVAVAVGNEGSGLTAAVRALARELVSLPIANDVESLNAAVAAALILYELQR